MCLTKLWQLRKEDWYRFSLRLQEEAYYKQKFRVQWPKEGDNNTKFFHNYVKARENRKRIVGIEDHDGNLLQEETLVHQFIVQHFQKFMEKRRSLSEPVDVGGFDQNRVLEEDKADMVSEVTDQEI